MNTTVIYTCKDGYQLYGRKIGEYLQSISCAINTTDGTVFWEGVYNLTSCIPINCENPPTFLNALLINTTYSNVEVNISNTIKGNPYFLGSTVIYACNSGYRFNHTGQLSAVLTCNTVPNQSHIAAWGPSNIACVRMFIIRKNRFSEV